MKTKIRQFMTSMGPLLFCLFTGTVAFSQEATTITGKVTSIF
ncbi:hypothetical protein EDD80_101265 [Anseongella ginsenosidimutans]|uniref:Uncharacterized protein n=1 Tax=Anseongella ginsenosidimutans TaxID=496056 RepID=A0A4R3KWC4_9SPHI|nr:hypothetical protein [Anseongella ginsenosidimutans]TCS90067.1 hypothetical protein EDD80_101265 [Anseongella ginsenosidimutans]